MCTAVSYQTKDHYFGRNLDLECPYGEGVVVTPRNYPFRFRRLREMSKHDAMLGVAVVEEGCPLYYDAVNEKGLAIAGLRFPDWATYMPQMPNWDNVTPFELPWWLLGQCATLEQARRLLERLNPLREDFRPDLPLTPMHWMLSDRTGSIVIEPMPEGLRVYDDPEQVLTNSPPFPFQRTNLSLFMGVSPEPAENRFFPPAGLKPCSCGMGGIGLPGDLSSSSRFVRAAFTRLNSISGQSEAESVNQVFHILNSVAQTRGTVRLGEGKCEVTVYSSCCNTDRGIYYYTTYDNGQITAVDLHRENLDGQELICYPIQREQRIYWQN